MADKCVSTNNVFEDLDVDHLEVNVIESLCFSCGKNVSNLFKFSNLLLTKLCEQIYNIYGYPYNFVVFSLELNYKMCYQTSCFSSKSFVEF